MKKVLLGLILGMFCLVSFGQAVVYKGEVSTVIDALDLSTIAGTDTTIYVYVPNGEWSMDMRFATVTGSGTAAIVCSHDGSNFYAYNTSPGATVTGASGSYQFEDDRLAWQYLGVKVTLSTITAGTLNVTLFIR